MKLPAGDAILDPTWLLQVIEDSPDWTYGPITVTRSERIGVGYGLSDSSVYRVEAESTLSGTLSFILKEESAEGVERALLFHRSNGSALRRSIPACLGGVVDRDRGRGVLFLDDVNPARQGDVLRGCTGTEANAAVRSLARVHAASWTDNHAIGTGLPRWSSTAMDSGEWTTRLSRAADEFPQILPPALVDRLNQLPLAVETAIESLEAGPMSWIHCDAHLDNVLFRPDGTAVLIDWSGATFGPPAVDVARLLTEGIDAGRGTDRARKLLATYARELDDNVVGTVPMDDLWRSLSDALLLLLLAAIGWAGRDEHREPRERMNALRKNLLLSCCAWPSHPQMAAPGQVFVATRGARKS